MKVSISNAQRSLDFFLSGLCWYLAYTYRFDYLPYAQHGLDQFLFRFTPLLGILTLVFFQREGLYKSQRYSSRYKEILSVFKANTLASLCLVIILYFFLDDRLSRLTIIIYYVVSSFLLTLTRILVRNYLRVLRKKGLNLRHVLLIGNGPQLKNYIETVYLYKDSGIRFMGWLNSEGLSSEFDIPELKETYKELKTKNPPGSVVLGYAGKDSEKTDLFLKEHYNDVIPIQVLPDLSYSLIGHQIEDFAGIPLLSVNQPMLDSFSLGIKRLFDFISAGIGLIIISPLMLLLSFLVKISSPGPIFFGQERVGLDGKTFTMWKFRTMKVAENNEDNTTWTSKGDPRMTFIGQIMRKTSLDELPQLWNVIVGEMSLIGPRPERPYFVEKFKQEIPGYMLRHKMKAGITGWAQINGWRGDTSIAKRIECDFFYIKNWSLWLDIKILFLTFWKGFINKNAY